MCIMYIIEHFSLIWGKHKRFSFSGLGMRRKWAYGSDGLVEKSARRQSSRLFKIILFLPTLAEVWPVPLVQKVAPLAHSYRKSNLSCTLIFSPTLNQQNLDLSYLQEFDQSHPVLQLIYPIPSIHTERCQSHSHVQNVWHTVTGAILQDIWPVLHIATVHKVSLISLTSTDYLTKPSYRKEDKN